MARMGSAMLPSGLTASGSRAAARPASSAAASSACSRSRTAAVVGDLLAGDDHRALANGLEHDVEHRAPRPRHQRKALHR